MQKRGASWMGVPSDVLHALAKPFGLRKARRDGLYQKDSRVWRQQRGRCAFVAAGLLLLAYLLWLLRAANNLDSEARLVPGIDVLGLNLRPTCVTLQSIRALNRYQQPRSIYVISPDVDSCVEKLQTAASNVRCLHEDSILPGITLQSIDDTLKGLYPALETRSFEKGRTPAGWYFQQMLKLGAAQSLKGLSDLFVIWDFDMIPLRPIPMLYPSPAAVPAKPGGSEAALDSSPVVVNIGGALADGYDIAYEQLFGRPIEVAPDGSSFVTHWIVVRKALMLEFLRELSGSYVEDFAWVRRVLENLSEEHLFQGFSEYASYVSWVRQTRPETQHVMTQKTWLRQPVGGQWGVALARATHPRGLCCPSALQLWLHRAMGYQYGGFEIGHHPVCRWTDPEFKRGYGV